MRRALIKWSDIEFGKVLGEGHSGTVTQGILRRSIGPHPEGTVVAVKRYKPWVLHERGQIERIFAEVETGRRIDHRGVMQVVGAVLDDAGHPALVMQYYDGPTLEQVLRGARDHRTPVPIATCFRYLRDIASAILCLHSHGVIHRDVKPANVIVTADGPVIGDFGVVTTRDLPEQTTTGAFLGTIRYAAPEYLFGAEYDERIDVYSFGAIAYELFANREAFGGERHWARIIAARASGEPPLEREVLEELSARAGYNVAGFVQYVLAKSRCDRRKRTLDLAALVVAIERRAWERSFVVDSGKIALGVKRFTGPFATAEAAAVSLRKTLTTEDLAHLRSVIAEHYWTGFSGVSTFALPAKVIRRLVRASAIEAQRGYKSFGVKLTPVVKEAFALGLLD